MAKTGDFGGLPSDQFKKVVNTFTLGASTPQEKIDVLEALAKEEHAATNCTDFNMIEVVMKCIEIDKLHKEIDGGTAPAGSIGTFVTLLGNLQALWKS